MTREERITQILLRHFNPTHIEVINTSSQHARHPSSPKTGESHFNILIVSSLFDNATRVVRHRMVYQLLEDDFKQGLHALSLETFAPSEFNPSSLSQ